MQLKKKKKEKELNFQQSLVLLSMFVVDVRSGTNAIVRAHTAEAAAQHAESFIIEILTLVTGIYYIIIY